MNARSDRVYLDHNATSPLRPEARRALLAALDTVAGNPSSLHREGQRAREVLETARERVAALLDVPASWVVFTSGGSEAIAAGVRGVCDRAPRGRRRILVSAVEHSAVLEAAKLAAQRAGLHVEAIPCDRDGRVREDVFLGRLGDDVALVALQWANNETGVVQPVERVAPACREAGVPLLVDAVQAAGKLPLAPRELGVDLLALSAHKLGGPQGIGALVVREGLTLAPLIAGGAQERRRRGGTEAVALAAAFGATAEAARQRLREEAQRLLRLRVHIESRLRDDFDDARIHGAGAPRLPNTVNFAIPGVPGEALAIALDVEGFAVATGSACASGAARPSHVVRAMGYPEEAAREAVRVSLGWNTTRDDVERFLEALPKVVARVRDGLRVAEGGA